MIMIKTRQNIDDNRLKIHNDLKKNVE